MSNSTLNTSKEELLKSFRKNLNGKALVPSVREQAQAALEKLEIPNRRMEDWKYTSLESLQKKNFVTPSPSEISDVDPFKIEGLVSDVLVFVNGVYKEELSSLGLNEGNLHLVPFHHVKGESLEVLNKYFGKLVASENNLFSAINTAYADQGLLIYVPKGKIAEHPVQIVHISTPEGNDIALQHRNLLVVEDNASAKVVESFYTIGEGSTLRNNLHEVTVGANAQLEYIKLQLEGSEASQIDHTEVHQGRDSKASVFTITMGGDLVRNNLIFRLNDQNTETHLMGTYLLNGRQHVDNFTQVNHQEPNCFSNELYKGILDEKSTGAFTGRINVFRDAQKTNAYQSNRNILLTKTANIFTKPQLEIYADDVKCSHGATTGQLDKEAMFYLKARGLSEDKARKLMIHAFTLEVIENISLEPVQEYLEQLVSDRY
ncbi:MAG: Fe-S cluster assembly protein SufD [Bacteroidia bacterium]|nr:Fe-S cluster assembly protein SufD [Bacteroidia bacterium]